MALSEEELAKFMRTLEERERKVDPTPAVPPGMEGVPEAIAPGSEAAGAGGKSFLNRLSFGGLPALTDALDTVNQGFNAARGAVRSVAPSLVPEGDIPAMSGDDTKAALARDEANHPVATTLSGIGGDVLRDLTIGRFLPFAKGGGLGASVGKQAAVGATAATGEELLKAARGEGSIPEAVGNIGLGVAGGAAGGAAGHALSRVLDPVQSFLGAQFPTVAPDVAKVAKSGLKEAKPTGAQLNAAQALELGGETKRVPAAREAARELATKAQGLLETGPGRAAREVIDATNAERLAARGNVLGVQRKGAEGVLEDTTKNIQVTGIGKVADEARKLANDAFANASTKVGKDSPQMWQHARQYLADQEAAATTDAGRRSAKQAIDKIDKLMERRTPKLAELGKIGREETRTGKVAGLLERPLAEPTAPPSWLERGFDVATRRGAPYVGGMTGGALGTAVGGPLIGAIGTGVGTGAGLLGQKIAQATSASGSKGAANLFLKDPEKFLEKSGLPSKSRDLLSLLLLHGLAEPGFEKLRNSKGFRELHAQ